MCKIPVAYVCSFTGGTEDELREKRVIVVRQCESDVVFRGATLPARVSGDLVPHGDNVSVLVRVDFFGKAPSQLCAFEFVVVYKVVKATIEKRTELSSSNETNGHG